MQTVYHPMNFMYINSNTWTNLYLFFVFYSWFYRHHFGDNVVYIFFFLKSIPILMLGLLTRIYMIFNFRIFVGVSKLFFIRDMLWIMNKPLGVGNNGLYNDMDICGCFSCLLRRLSKKRIKYILEIKLQFGWKIHHLWSVNKRVY